MSPHEPILPKSEQEITSLFRELVAKVDELNRKNEQLVAKNEEYAGMILALRENVQLLKDEIAVLKGQKPRPKIPPNKLENDKSNSSGDGGNMDCAADKKLDRKLLIPLVFLSNFLSAAQHMINFLA